MLQAVTRRLERAIHELHSLDPRDVSARLTLLLLVLYGPGYWDLSVPTVMLAAAGMTIPPLARQPYFWGALTLIQAVGVIPRVYVIDNHKVLMVYWCLALSLSMKSRALLAHHSRLLIGWCFLFAAYWKAVTPGFVDGSFLHFTMLTDTRFTGFAQIVAGIDAGVLDENRSALRSTVSGDVASARLLDSRFAGPLALSMTLWTLVSEVLIAVTFLLSKWIRLARNLRHVVLAQFVCFTYPVATVVGFGWLLTIMGYAQTGRMEGRSRIVFLGLFLAMQLFLVPWERLVLGK
ncbi:hypothetical protein [Engelhardtia mirabilis]|uniref:Uncharacterized protein n=1 Tax=Engelhardtia mirabilis TaxID=2528011 RepID=A0A518BS45_9BACT|nr:hypothetical protein Pla133_49070 [Planctomycetes bacterium Pla133]QDV04111.1 hypothetical protein Pla86_49050 [Planctomycetes bacterium Pla86]